MPPESEWPVDETVARGLLTRHLPQWAHLDLSERFEGWDNVTWRCGDALAVRLPRIGAAVELLLREQRWLPRLSDGWPFEVPCPVHVGEPDEEFPRPWSVLRWVEGLAATTGPLVAPAAIPLARILACIHRPSPPDAPDTPWRTASLAQREPELLEALASPALAASGLDRSRLEELWGSGRDLTPGGGVWVHADLHAANVVTRDGLPVGVLDWGEVCAGDPAVDVAMAWALLPDQESVEVFLDEYARLREGTDEALVARARAHALLACAVIASGSQGPLAESGRRGLVLLGVLPPS